MLSYNAYDKKKIFLLAVVFVYSGDGTKRKTEIKDIHESSAVFLNLNDILSLSSGLL